MAKMGQGSGGGPTDEDKGMQAEARSGGSDVSGAKIDSRVQSEIGRHLRAIYDDVIKEPVPSKFLELLEQLEQSTKSKN